MPPTENCPAENWCCGYCEFHSICELVNVPSDYHEDKNTTATHTDNPAVIEALNNLASARAIAKHARELEDEAKSVLCAEVHKKGLASVQGGGFICFISERSSNRFDAAAFKKVHPDLAKQFSKKTSSIYYEIKEVTP